MANLELRECMATELLENSRHDSPNMYAIFQMCLIIKHDEIVDLHSNHDCVN